MLLTDASHGRTQAADHITLAKFTDTIANAPCDVSNGIAGALGDAAHG